MPASQVAPSIRLATTFEPAIIFMPSIPSQFFPLPYQGDSALLFAAWADQPWAMFLDSGHPFSQQGRYDVLAAEPVCTLETRGAVTTVAYADGATHASTADPFALVQQQLQRFMPLDSASDKAGLPFIGGAIGYFGYDLARRLEHLPTLAAETENLPDMAVGIYSWAVVVDHQRQRSILVCHGLDTATCQRLQAVFSRPSSHPARPFALLGDITPNLTSAEYAAAFQRIKQYLKAGDCYQVNFSQRFAAPCSGDPWAVYLALRQANAAPYSGFLHVPGVQVLSSSPERFLKVRAGQVETKPIKGTRPRKPDAQQDHLQINSLQNSSKDKAENLMIVDLLRNDLGKTCQIGSVQVPKLFAVESYATVHHLVSTVTGTLAENQQALDLLRSCFPGGSITGAPKIRAMEIIEELEPNRRGIYCGAMGYISFDGNMDSNIAIRTLVHAGGTIRFWAGGGIVNDSEWAEEYQECFDKAAALLNVLQQFRGG